MEGTQGVTVRDNIASIAILGPIFPRANIFTEMSGATSLAMVARDFNTALENPKVEQIILGIDSPGGQITGVSDFAEMVAASDKPVTVVVDGQANSAAFWIASAADEIVLSPTAIVGSVGVMLEVGQSESGGVIFTSSQSPLKNADPSSEAGAEDNQTLVNDLAQVFIETVAANRGLSVETVMSDFGRGGVKVGAKAVAAGMADRVASVETVIAGFSGNEEITMSETKAPVITSQYICDEHPAVYADISTSQYEAGKDIGAENERARIQAVLGQSLPGV